MLTIVNAKLFDGKGQFYENASFTVEDGKFVEIDVNSTKIKHDGAIDVKGKFITPGLIDVHTHLGVDEEGVGEVGDDFNETSSASTPQVRAIDGINPEDLGFEDARSSGVTTVQIMPGSANVIGGEMVVLKTVGHIVDKMVVKSPSGLKAAMGENPKRLHGDKGKLPITRMGVAAMIREKLIEGENYLRKREEGSTDRDLGLETISKVLMKQIPLRVHAHRADDIATALRIKREFDIDLTIEHCTEGHHLASFIAEHDVSVSFGPTLPTRSKAELVNKGWHTLLALQKAKVPFSLTTDHPVIGIDTLMMSAMMAVKNGLSEKEALAAITIHAAKHLGIEDKVGSIEIRKDADFVIWDGNPFNAKTFVAKTYINGELVYKK